jgi:endonuclease/exonuclease/phosphatase family metal-dependent hydrolase
MMASNSKDINVLSYNVSWGSMSENPHNRSAAEMAKYCQKLGNKTCLKNVVKIIDENGPYDFIALQECAGWQDMIRHSALLPLMGYVHHKTPSRIELITFYNKDKYMVIAIKQGFILNDGRPYHIIFLIHKISNTFYIVINMHNEHIKGKRHTCKEILQIELSKNLDKSIIIVDVESGQTEFKDSNQISEQGINIFKELELIRAHCNVIVVGDFNDNNKREYWKGINPFKNTLLKHIKVSNHIKSSPPPTCCVGKSKLRKRLGDDRGCGDYILINHNLEYIHNNIIPVFEYDARVFPTSDHLPIYSRLRETNRNSHIPPNRPTSNQPRRNQGGAISNRNNNSVNKGGFRKPRKVNKPKKVIAINGVTMYFLNGKRITNKKAIKKKKK